MALTFGQVTDILMVANSIPEERRGTFVARLKQWQKMGFPEGVRGVGRGVKVSYGADQLYQLALHMRLLTLGLTPERAQNIIRSAWQKLTDAIVVTALRKANEEGGYCYLLIQLDSLTELRDPGSSHDHVYVSATMDDMIVDAFEGRDDLEGEDKAIFEHFQLLLRNALVNAIVLEIDSIVVRIWLAMSKLGIAAEVLTEDMHKWMVDMIDRDRRDEEMPVPLPAMHDNLAGVEIDRSGFAAVALGLQPAAS